MSRITISEGIWVCSSRFVTKTKRERISKEKREEVIKTLAAFVPGGVGKGKRYRYLSDFNFKTEAEAHKFWDKHLSGDLAEFAEIGEQFQIVF